MTLILLFPLEPAMKKQPSLLAAAILSLFLAACGDKAAEPAASAPAPAPTAPAVETPATPAPEAAAPTAPEAAAPAPAASETTAAATATDSALGKSVYGKTCALCHGAGIAGAPKPGDKDDWGPRIAQGNDTLYKHAIEGFTGAKGMMPPRGGGANLSDDEVKAAVDYMVAQSK